MNKLKYEVENQLLSCWNVVSDMKFFYEEHDKWADDERLNYLNGMIVKYDKQFPILFKMFQDIDFSERTTASSQTSFKIESLNEGYDYGVDF